MLFPQPLSFHIHAKNTGGSRHKSEARVKTRRLAANE
jgi:hypothetical protein